MFRPLAPLNSKPPKFNPRPALQNPAVFQCKIASENAFRSGLSLTGSRMLARKEAGEAFRQELPPLSGLENIGNFIACVAFAISTGVFVDGSDAELLYAAQIALKSMALKSRREMLRGKKTTFSSNFPNSNREYKELSAINSENKGLAKANGSKKQ